MVKLQVAKMKQYRDLMITLHKTSFCLTSSALIVEHSISIES